LYTTSSEYELESDFSLCQNVFIEADKEQLIRLFHNLLKNAVQSIPAEVHGEINLTCKMLNGKVEIAISDNGIGIDEEQALRIFTPNFTTKSSGMGLGLAMSKSIVEQFNGNIRFESKLNTGTVFYVAFPLVG
jgi:signal transduction histidine kinase